MDRWLICFTILDTLLEIRSLWAQSGKHAHSLHSCTAQTRNGTVLHETVNES
jgi:hypothetical protein